MFAQTVEQLHRFNQAILEAGNDTTRVDALVERELVATLDRMAPSHGPRLASIAANALWLVKDYFERQTFATTEREYSSRFVSGRSPPPSPEAANIDSTIARACVSRKSAQSVSRALTSISASDLLEIKSRLEAASLLDQDGHFIGGIASSNGCCISSNHGPHTKS